MIKAICFDLDGVYFTEDGKRGFHNSLVELVKDEEKVVHVLYKSQEMLDFVRGKMSEEAFWEYFRGYLGISITDEECRQLWIKNYEINESVRKVVLKVRDAGYKTCVCSNNNIARVEALQAKYKFMDDFDVCTYSYRVGYVKPHIEIFKALLEEAGVKGSELIYSDDNPERLQGATKLGINTFVYNNFGQFKSVLTEFGVRF